MCYRGTGSSASQCANVWQTVPDDQCFRWWEGVVQGVNDDDESQITVYFPGLPNYSQISGMYCKQQVVGYRVVREVFVGQYSMTALVSSKRLGWDLCRFPFWMVCRLQSLFFSWKLWIVHSHEEFSMLLSDFRKETLESLSPLLQLNPWSDWRISAIKHF